MTDTGFPYGDIIVIGAIAAFILLRYRAMLGESHGRDARPSQKPAPMNEFERVIQLPAATLTAMAEKKDEPKKDYGSLSETFADMRAIDRDFTPEDFLQGARAAYEMVIEGFGKGDRGTLKMLLSDPLYKQFDASITAEEAEGKRSDTTLTALLNATITDARLVGSNATLTVDFVSEQIQLVRDKEGEIIEGDPSHQEKVEDQWVFTRNLTSNDFNWKIIET